MVSRGTAYPGVFALDRLLEAVLNCAVGSVAELVPGRRSTAHPPVLTTRNRGATLRCACGGTAGPGGECAACRARRLAREPRRAGRGPEWGRNFALLPTHSEHGRNAAPLDSPLKDSLERQFGESLTGVHVHTDDRAARAAARLGALAFTHGSNVYFAAGQYQPGSQCGRWMLTHELVHVLQQRRGEQTALGRSPAQGPHSPSIARKATVGGPEAAEGEADRVATALISPLGAHPAPRVRETVAPGAIQRLTPAQFRAQLGANDAQKAAIAALFANRTFKALWDYLAACTAGKKDLGPLTLKVTPGLKIGGVERYGGYDPVARALEINPTKPEHLSNSAELVDTITHELIHAVDDLEADCKKAGSNDAPLAGAATAHAPTRAQLAGDRKEEARLMKEQGPGASNPCEEFIDINKAAQQIIINVIRENITVARVGRPTVTFVNEILRRDPAAMREYVACRDAACKQTDPDKRRTAVGKCSSAILTKYMPPDLKPKP